MISRLIHLKKSYLDIKEVQLIKHNDAYYEKGIFPFFLLNL